MGGDKVEIYGYRGGYQKYMMNENELWADIIVDEFVKLGVKYACIGVGSRSTPITLALSKNKEINSISFIDERTAGFFALGLARASRLPSVLVSTSGTAVGNFLPAILEAKYLEIPLIVISADRPHELRGTGANQTMDQIQFFGDHVKEFIEMSIPDPNPLQSMIRGLRMCICKSFYTSLDTPNGAVHINMPFRKPLEPSLSPRRLDLSKLSDNELHGREDSPYLVQFSRKSEINEHDLDIISSLINKHEKKVMVVGPSTSLYDQRDILYEFSRNFSIPILADPASGIRFGKNCANVIGSYDTFLKNVSPQTDLIIILGNVPTSNALHSYIEKSKAVKIAVNHSSLKDATNTYSYFIKSEPHSVISKLLDEKLTKNSTKFLEEWKSLEKQTISKLSNIKSREFEGNIYKMIFSALENGTSVYVGNSLAIRLLDQFVPKMEKDIRIYHNRGLSGIDGNISIASGIAYHKDTRVTVFLGDLSFYHDLNALLNLNKNKIKLTIILINNQGGGIFHRLPISKFEPEFTEYFLTPHDLNFKKIVEGFGVTHHLVDSSNIIEYYRKSFSKEGPVVLEIQTDSQKTQEIINSI